MAEFVKVASLQDVPEGKSKYVKVNGKDLALFNVGGEIHCIENNCPHQGGPLSEGDFHGKEVTCPWHNWKFDVTTGDCTVIDTVCVVKFKSKVEENEIWVKV